MLIWSIAFVNSSGMQYEIFVQVQHVSRFYPCPTHIQATLDTACAPKVLKLLKTSSQASHVVSSKFYQLYSYSRLLPTQRSLRGCCSTSECNQKQKWQTCKLEILIAHSREEVSPKFQRPLQRVSPSRPDSM
jgi:hypothetical protein